MKRHHATLSVGLLVAATACGDILGIDDNSVSVICFADKDCERPLVCREHKCVALGGTSGNAGTSHGGSGGLFATSGGTAGSGGSGIVPVSGGTGGVSITTGGLAGTTASEGGTESIGGTGGIVASGGTQSVGGESGTAGSTTFVGGGGGIAGHGGATPSGGTGGTSGASTSGAGMTHGGVGGHIVTGGTAGIGAAGTGAIGNNGGVSGGGTSGVSGIAGTGTGAIAGVGGSGGCTPGTHRCYPQEPGDFADYEDEVRIVGHPVSLQTCDAQGKWDVGVGCLGYCSAKKGKCEDGISCNGLSQCNGPRNCCNSLPLPISTNTFNRSREGDSCPAGSLCPAKVSAFMLDTFEVTVGRFRNFVSQFPSSIPKAGDGKNPNNLADPGWSDAWTSLIPATQSELTQNLVGCTGTTYSAQSEGHDFEPINCVNWYLAFAFCIWDGGRLPTEAEWIYAASGGQSRIYPWSIPFDNPIIEPADDYAIFNYNYTDKWTRPQRVGSATKGKARWGQHDMAGNVFEWVADAYANVYPDPEACLDCANFNSLAEVPRIVHGGSFDFDESALCPDYRMSTLSTRQSQRYGFRCARNP